MNQKTAPTVINSQLATSAPPRLTAEPVEYFVDPQAAADYLRISRKHVLEMVRKGLIPGHPLDATSKKKDWRFLLSELRDHMLQCDQRPPEAYKRRRV